MLIWCQKSCLKLFDILYRYSHPRAILGAIKQTSSIASSAKKEPTTIVNDHHVFGNTNLFQSYKLQIFAELMTGLNWGLFLRLWHKAPFSTHNCSMCDIHSIE